LRGMDLGFGREVTFVQNRPVLTTSASSEGGDEYGEYDSTDELQVDANDPPSRMFVSSLVMVLVDELHDQMQEGAYLKLCNRLMETHKIEHHVWTDLHRHIRVVQTEYDAVIDSNRLLCNQIETLQLQIRSYQRQLSASRRICRHSRMAQDSVILSSHIRFASVLRELRRRVREIPPVKPLLYDSNAVCFVCDFGTQTV